MPAPISLADARAQRDAAAVVLDAELAALVSAVAADHETVTR